MPPVQRVCDHLFSIADALVSTGLREAGYEYVNLDCGWTTGCNCALIYVLVEPVQWPFILASFDP
eukprot:5386505-Prymnesium_polylepis.2